MTEHDLMEWDRQTSILKGAGYTTDEINNKSFNDRHQMIRNNCRGYELGDIYNFNRDEHELDF